ncbi:MAG: hypothetical protein A3F18_07315 [Legionellales bacterium RIFCSPHIGHO2_12_FULL_37_14]|nr:MAG: hypothetical protein A3F18_07315 [Legionellales bacterium RIFCSPHIGHO2_12_FULL_37_14]
MRFDKPTGIYLLLSPVLWALWVANNGRPPWYLLSIFVLGTIIMRALGCILNDIADRRIDIHVQRTNKRPLATLEVSLGEALALVLFFLIIAFLLLLRLPPKCFYFALVAICLTAIYPFCKRFLSCPQSILALAFSVAIPMVYVASNKAFDLNMLLLICINTLWVISYDTIYAWVDKEDDKKVGVKSSALLWGDNTRKIIISLQIFIQVLWILLGLNLGLTWFFGIFWLLGSSNLGKQQELINSQSSPKWFLAFKLNGMYGAIMWLGLCYFLVSAG